MLDYFLVLFVAWTKILIKWINQCDISLKAHSRHETLEFKTKEQSNQYYKTHFTKVYIFPTFQV